MKTRSFYVWSAVDPATTATPPCWSSSSWRGRESRDQWRTTSTRSSRAPSLNTALPPAAAVPLTKSESLPFFLHSRCLFCCVYSPSFSLPRPQSNVCVSRFGPGHLRCVVFLRLLLEYVLQRLQVCPQQSAPQVPPAGRLPRGGERAPLGICSSLLPRCRSCTIVICKGREFITPEVTDHSVMRQLPPCGSSCE